MRPKLQKLKLSIPTLFSVWFICRDGGFFVSATQRVSVQTMTAFTLNDKRKKQKKDWLNKQSGNTGRFGRSVCKLRETQDDFFMFFFVFKENSTTKQFHVLCFIYWGLEHFVVIKQNPKFCFVMLFKLLFLSLSLRQKWMKTMNGQLVPKLSVYPACFLHQRTHRENTKTPSITTETRTRYLIAVR